MQSIQDPERRQYNSNPKWEVPLEVWTCSLHQTHLLLFKALPWA